jgi:hypothetical protein
MERELINMPWCVGRLPLAGEKFRLGRTLCGCGARGTACLWLILGL